MVYLLDSESVAFPPGHLADDDGLLAVGGKLNPDWVKKAYQNGIFPWFNSDETEIMWWCPNPRMVLAPGEIKISKSMRKFMRETNYDVRINSDFKTVIEQCANMPRRDQDGTWITDEMQRVYIELHESGWAHSVEIWVNGQLRGGLYGIAIDNLFCGESMFSLDPNMSKLALIELTHFCSDHDIKLIDCQMETDHLRSMGAHPIPREAFLNQLKYLMPNGKPLKW
jgi:leucyl/phenylalanyl-tRNA--protein transferase